MPFSIPSDGPVVFVDDDDIFRSVMELMYQMSGLENQFVEIESGEAALAYFENYDANIPYPAVIYMDINMPGINGIETVRRIRQLQNFKDTPIITMLSSSDEKHDIENSKKAGANDYMVKPQSNDELAFKRV